MNNTTFHFSKPTITYQTANSYNGNDKEKNLITEIINEWNSRISISLLCKQWKRDKPLSPKQNLLFLL